MLSSVDMMGFLPDDTNMKIWGFIFIQLRSCQRHKSGHTACFFRLKSHKNGSVGNVVAPFEPSCVTVGRAAHLSCVYVDLAASSKILVRILGENCTNVSWQLIILSCVVYHSGQQPTPHMGLLTMSRQKTNESFFYHNVFQILTNRSTKRSSTHSCKHAEVKRKWCCWCCKVELWNRGKTIVIFSFFF